jgi:phytoene desaturase
MRTVPGPTDRVVVVGAGLAGLSAALRLAGAGRTVTVCEQAEGPGGLAGRVEAGGYRLDTGPTVLTLPDTVADALGAIGERLADWLDLVRLDPIYRATFADGSAIAVRADPQATEEEIRRVCGPAEAAGFRRFTGWLTELYRVQRPAFIERNLDGPLAVLRPALARLAALGGLRRLDTAVNRYLADPRTRRLFSFQSLYVGVPPHRALAAYAVVTYLDTVGGVYFPVGGIHAVPAALAAAGGKHGVDLRYRTRVCRVELSGRRALAVHTSDGERIAADVVVLTVDPAVAYPWLLPDTAAPRRLSRRRNAPSCFLVIRGGRPAHRAAAHHTIHFGAEWSGTFRDLVDRKHLPADPSLLVSVPTVTDPTLAPPGRAIHYLLAPVPTLDAGLDWTVLGPRYRTEVLARLQQREGPALAGPADVEVCRTPGDWRAAGGAAGTPFGAAHTALQTGPFRTPTLARGLDNVLFAGASAQPGIGVPMALISGRLAAERVLR